jgi:hypothetical protein
MKLILKLRDGFDNDTVQIKANGREVYHKSGISTDLTISFADSVEIDVRKSIVDLEVTVEGGEKQKKEIDVKKTQFVEVWCIDGKMELRASHDEVPMM